jgi:hypothetical protein
MKTPFNASVLFYKADGFKCRLLTYPASKIKTNLNMIFPDYCREEQGIGSILQ